MPDWEQLVAARLARLNLPPDIQREVIAEIAAHLDECYEGLVKAGSADPEGQTLDQVADWPALCRKINRTREDRMGFLRRIVMPGIAAAMLALAILKVCVALLVLPTACGPGMSCLRVAADGPAYLPWLATLPLVGALAAALARRMGARRVERLAAAMFPALYFAVEIVAMSLLHAFFWRIPLYWVVVPAVACAVGAWPFLRGGDHARSTPSSHADLTVARV